MTSDEVEKPEEFNSTASGSELGGRRFRVLHWSISILLCLFSGIALSGLSFLRFDDDLKSLFRGETQEFRDFVKYSQLFGNNDDQCVVLLSSENVLSISSLKSIRILDSAVHDVEHVKDVNSLCHLLSSKRVGRLLLPVLPYEGADANAWERAADQLSQHPLGLGNLYSHDGRYALLTFRLDSDATDAQRQASIAEIKRLAQKHWIERAEYQTDQTSSLGFGLTGFPILREEVTSNLQRDQQKFTWLGLVFALVIGWFLFRKPIPVLFVAAVPFLGLGCIMGILGWINVPLNIVNNVITPLVLVIGFAEVIHILFLTGGLMGRGLTSGEAVLRMLQQLWMPCLLAALTTAIGFGSLYLSTDTSLREFAIVASISSLVMFAMVLATSACLLATPIASYCVRTPNANHKLESEQTREWSIGFRLALLLSMIACVVIVWSTKSALANHSDYRFTENLPESNPSVKTLRQIDQGFGGSSGDQLIVAFDKKPTPTDLIETLREIRDNVESLDSVGTTSSLINLLDSLEPKGGSDLQHFRELRYYPRETWERFLKINPTIASVRLRLPDLGSAKLTPVLNEIDRKLQQTKANRTGVTTTVSGLNILAIRRSQQMIGDLSRSLMGASVTIFLLILIVYRSIIFAVASIIVNAIPILGVAAIMSSVGQPIQYTGIMLLCVCLGLAVDDTVHFLSKLKLLLGQGMAFDRAVMATIGHLWPVFLTTSVMLGVGFGLAATSEIPTFQTFGGFACVALFLALLADLIFLPCILIVLNRMQMFFVSARAK